MYIPQDQHLVLHMPTSWLLAVQSVTSVHALLILIPHTRFQYIHVQEITDALFKSSSLDHERL